MGEKAVSAIIGIVTGVVGISILAVLVSNQSNTSNVLTSAGNAFSGIIKAAVSPVTSSSSGLGNLSSGLFGSGSGL